MAIARSLARAGVVGSGAGFAAARGAVALAMLVPVLMELGWRASPWGISGAALHWSLAGLWVVYAGLLVTEGIRRLRPGGGGAGWARFVRVTLGEHGIAALALLSAWSFAGMSWCVAVLVVLTAVRAYARLVRAGMPPSLVFLLSFVVLIGAGAGLLTLPAATPQDKPIGAIDALFTSTSAVCVTGLIVRDTATEFTRFGQVVILALIQAGGLGIILFGALLLLAFGGAVDLRSSREITAGATGVTAGMSAGDFLKRVILIVLCAELIGAGVLFFGWPSTWAGAPSDFGSVGGRAFHSVFFAVSAFCNAGFATSTTGLQGLRFHWTSHVVIVALITLGGIGMPVLMNAGQVLRARWRHGRGARRPDGGLVRLTLHTKIVVSATVVIYAMGAAGILLSRMTQGNQELGAALLDAHFMSVSTRTAGFDTVAPAEMGILARFVMMVQMFIGGSPASAAGGVKTVAVAAVALTVWNTIRGRAETNAFGREIPDELVRRAAVLIVMGLVTVAALATVLTVTDPHGVVHQSDDAEAFEEILFESVSACGTVGLSMGLTSSLSEEGRVAVSVGMFLGRVGPLAFLMAIAGVSRRRLHAARYAREDVVMG